jgi:hypothetical protein
MSETDDDHHPGYLLHARLIDKEDTVTDRKALMRLLAEAAANTARLPVSGKAAPKTLPPKQRENPQRSKGESSDKQEPS